MNRYRSFLTGAMLLAILEPTATSAPARLGLSDTVDRALARSAAVAQAREGVLEAAAGLSEARLSRLPRLTARSVVSRGDDPVYAFSSLLRERRFGPQNFAIEALNHPDYLTNIQSSLDFGVPLFTGFRWSSGRALSRLSLTAAGVQEESSIQAVRYQVLESYLRLALDAARLEDVRERIASAEAEIDDAKRLRARGLVLGSDFYAAEALMGGLRAEKIRLESEREAVQSDLGILLGDSEGIEPVGSLQDVSYDLPPLSTLIESALRERQDLRRSDLAETSARVIERQERWSLLPRFEAFASLETDTSDFGANPTNRTIGLRAELPWGDPAYFARRARAASSARAASAGRRSLEESARIEVSERYRAYRGASAAFPILREAVEKADRSLELFKPLYREGRQSILDVLRAEDALLKARAGYLETAFETHVDYARLALSLGRLDAAAVREIESRLRGQR